MLSEVRLQKVIDLLVRQKSLRISELRALFDVSEETLRRDLKRLEAEGILKRTHGGAILNEEVHMVPPYSQRSQQFREDKAVIAERAAGLVADRASVILDTGSTTLEIARRLAGRDVTVVTNDLTIAMELSQSLYVHLIVTGGTQQKGSFSLTGPECEETIRRYHVDMVFLGAGGIGVKQGLTTASSAEAQVKRAMIEAGTDVYCVADQSKLGKAALVSFAQVSDLTGIITNASAHSEMVEELEQCGARLVLV